MMEVGYAPQGDGRDTVRAEGPSWNWLREIVVNGRIRVGARKGGLPDG